jgi:hypothetical protein
LLLSYLSIRKTFVPLCRTSRVHPVRSGAAFSFSTSFNDPIVIKLAIAAKSGDIKKATIVEKRTTIKDKTIRASALESARQIGWKSSSSKYEVELTYKFSR